MYDMGDSEKAFWGKLEKLGFPLPETERDERGFIGFMERIRDVLKASALTDQDEVIALASAVDAFVECIKRGCDG